MPDLDLGPPPSSSPTRSIVAAAVILILAAAGFFFWMSRQKGELTVTAAKPYEVHIENKAIQLTGGKGPHVVGIPSTTETDLYVVVTVRLTNHLHEPMFIKDEHFSVISPDQSEAATDALQKADLDDVLQNFPDLKPLVGTPLLRDTKVDSGQTVEGTLLLNYPTATEEFWNKRSSAAATLSFFHQNSITAQVPK